jgi:hypothetical protein
MLVTANIVVVVDESTTENFRDSEAPEVPPAFEPL